MASNTNNALLAAMDGPWPAFVRDSLFIAAGQTSQATARVLARAGVNRVIGAPANGAILLPAMLNEDEGADLIFVVNDSANTIQVFPSPGETMQAVANAAFAIAAGASGIFLCMPPNLHLGQQSVAATSVFDWRPALMT